MENKINQIKEIIDYYGNFSVGEIKADYSPTVRGQNGNLSHLIECFYKDFCNVNVYSEHTEYPVDVYDINYENLDEDTLLEILELAVKYKQMQVENEK